MRPDFDIRISLKKLAWQAAVVLAPLVGSYIELLQTNATPKYAPWLAGVVLIWRWWQNASKKPQPTT